MAGSRDGAIARVRRCFDDGTFLAALRRLVAAPIESQMEGSLPALTRYCAETMPALMDGMGFATRVVPNLRESLAADVFIGLDGPRQATFMPELRLGAGAAVAFDLIVYLRDHAHHSGHWGGMLRDPALRLAHALPSIVTPEDRILVDGWTPPAIPPCVKRAIAGLVFDDTLGLPEPDAGWGEPGLTKGEKIFGWTSVIVLAQVTGHPDAPTNAVQGAARAGLQVRHTADVRGASIVPALRRHLDASGFDDVAIEPVFERDMFGAARTDPDALWVAAIAASMAATAGRAPNIVPNSSGSNPSDMFLEERDIPVIWIPNSYAGCNQHGPDEHALAPLLREGLGLMAGLWWNIGAGAAPTRRAP